MKNAWLQRAHREGIILKWVDLKLPSEDNDYLVEQFVNQFTAKTKLVHLTHMINWNGQVLPVRRIADIAKRKGIEVLVDGAHSFCHLDFKISDLNCDYFGTSLHKWMCAPFGTGLLHVRKEKIKNLYPLFAGPNPEAETANKFENLGTRSIAIEQGIGQAINFHQMIGMERKNKRLNHLKEYWTSKAKEIPGVSFGTSLNPEYGCAITLLQIPEKDEAVLTRKLLNKYRIHTVYINHENVKGIRITPNVYTLKKDLDYFIDSLHKIVKD